MNALAPREDRTLTLEERLERCLAPLSPAPAGRDARTDHAHESIRAEIAKLSDARGKPPDWALIAQLGLDLLSGTSKDILIASFVAAALFETRGPVGLGAGLKLLASLLSNFGASAFPTRLRARAGALEWFCQLIAERLPRVVDVPREQARALHAEVSGFVAAVRGAGPDLLADVSALVRVSEQFFGTFGVDPDREQLETTPIASEAPAEATPDPASLPSLVERWLAPIPGSSPAGADTTYDDVHVAVRAEIEKLQDLSRELPNWQAVLAGCSALLGAHTKDLGLAAYLARALYERHGVVGLKLGLATLEGLCKTYWDAAWPPRSRMKRRASAIVWLVNGLSEALTIGAPSDLTHVHDLAETLARLDATLRAQFGAEGPSLEPLSLAVSRLVALCPAASSPTASSEVLPEARATEPAQPAPTATCPPAASSSARNAGAPSLGPEPQATEPTASEPAVPEPAVSSAPGSAASGLRVAKTSATARPAPTAPAAAISEAQLASSPASSPPVPSAPAADVLATFGRAPGDAIASGIYVHELGQLLVGAARARFLEDPKDPRSYHWLRTGLSLSFSPPDAGTDGKTAAEAPDPALSAQLASALRDERWSDALAHSEALLAAHPFWLDAQWTSARALERLGAEFAPARRTVEVLARALAARSPELLDRVFCDGAPCACPDARAWLEQQTGAANAQTPSSDAAQAAASNAAGIEAQDRNDAPPLEEEPCAQPADQASDPSALAAEVATRIVSGELAAAEKFDQLLRTCDSGRAAFRLRLQLAAALQRAGKTECSVRLYLGLERDLDAHGLETWEPALCTELLQSLAEALTPLAASNPVIRPELMRVHARLARLTAASFVTA